MARSSSPAVHVRGVTVRHSVAVPVLSDLDLDLTAGWTGLVGANGVGKTTLLRVLAGEIIPDAGRVDVVGDVGPVLVPQQLPSPTREVEAVAWDWSGPAARLRSRLDLAPDVLARWDTLSPGQRTRWAVAAALLHRPDVLLLDEPTNHLDGDAREVLVTALQQHRGVGVVVSHDRTLLDLLTDTTVRLRGPAGADVVRAPWSTASAQWRDEAAAAARDEAAARREETRLRGLRSDARRARHSAEAGAAAARRHAGHRRSDEREAGRRAAADAAEASLARRVRAIGSRLDRAEQVHHHEPSSTEAGALTVHGSPDRRATVASLSTAALHAGDAVVLRDIDVAVARHDRIRVTGANGAGKSTLLAALVAATTGASDGPAVGHLPQPQRDDRTLDRVRMLPPDERGRILGAVAVLGIDPDRVLASDAPSPGEVRKLRLAELLVGDHALLVLDEPTTHLDLPAVERLEEALADWSGALVLVSHDEAFATATTTRTWRVADGAVTT